MKNINFQAIKKSSVISVLSSVTSRRTVMRSEIAAETGLSLMTVCKIVDSLLSLGILTETKEVNETAGRRAGLLSLCADPYAVVLDLSERSFKMNIFDFRLDLIDSMRFTYSNKHYYDENLLMFFKSAASFLRERCDLSNMIGIGISVPGVYIPDDDEVISSKIPELNSIALKSTAERVFGTSVPVIMKNVSAAAASSVDLLPQYRDAVNIYIFIGETINGAVYERGSFLYGAHGVECDFGKMIVKGTQTLESRVAQCKNDLSAADELSLAVYNLVTIFDPDVFNIESEMIREPEIFIANVKEALVTKYGLAEDHIPEFIFGKNATRHSARGVAMKLRELWFESKIS